MIATEAGGNVVGLEGEWGSGKSTVVQLMREQLDQLSPDTRVVVFDAWAHQGDPLRRTFLETIIADLKRAGWLDPSAASRASRELSGTSSVVTTKTSSSLSAEGKLAAAATVLIALGAALFANHFSHLHRLFLAIGGVLLVAPLILVLGMWIARRAAGHFLRRKRRPIWQTLAELNPSSFFARDQRTETTTEGVQQGEPTSVEFEDIFSRVLGEALVEPRSLVVVLDNLDRVDHEDARHVLATMQTIMAPGSAHGEWGSRLWILIPYDAAGLESLWAPGDASEVVPVPRLTVASAFLDKLFQVRFSSPPLVLSDWRDYTLRLLGTALPDEDASTLQSILRLRGLYPGAVPEGAVAVEPPTPRQLKQFVNQIGALRLQRDDVPLVHVAYYVLLRRDSLDLPRALLDGTVPHGKLAHLFQASVLEDVAALHFGTGHLLAQQLLLGPALEQAFSTNDHELLEGLRERPGFVDALEGIDLEARATDGGIELTRCVAVLEAAGALSVESVKQWARALLDPIAEQTTSWRVQGRESGVGLAVLMERVSAGSSERLAELLAKVATAPVEADTEGHGYLEGVAGLSDQLDRFGRASEEVALTLTVAPASLVDSLDYLQGQLERPNSHRLLAVGASPADVAVALVEASADGSVAKAKNTFDFLARKHGRLPVTDVASRAVEWLRENEPVSQEQLALLLHWLDRARLSAGAEATLAAPADDGSLLHLIAVSVADGWYPEAAAASMLQLAARPELPDPPATTRQSPTGLATLRQGFQDRTPPELVAAQLAWLQNHSKEAFDLVVRARKAPGAAGWADEQLRSLADAGAFVTSRNQLLRDWGYVRGVLGDELFMKHIRESLDLDSARSALLSGITSPSAALDAIRASEAGEQAPYLADAEEAAARVLSSASPDDWAEAFRSSSTKPLLSLALRLAGSSMAPKNPPGLQEAIHAHFQVLANEAEAEADVWRPDAASFMELSRLLRAPARRVLASQFCAELEGRDGQVGQHLCQTYGDFLAGEAAFRSHAKLPNVIERFLAREQWSVVGWFVGLSRKHPDALDEGGRQEEMQHLRDQVRDKLAAASDSAPEELVQLGELFGLERPGTDKEEPQEG